VRVFAMETFSPDVRWTRDSRAVAFAQHGAIYVQPIDGGRAMKIVDFSPDEIESFDWTADGSSLIVARTARFRGLVAIENFR
jgi:hypothetical protein